MRFYIHRMGHSMYLSPLKGSNEPWRGTFEEGKAVVADDVDRGVKREGKLSQAGA